MRLQPCALAAALLVAVTRAPAAADAPSIAELQSELRAAGYDPGPVDGVMSKKTERAMRTYGRAHGQPIAADPVRAAQAALGSLGFLAAPPDGVVGPRTRDAIIRFQTAHHLPVDPRVSDGLLAALEHASQPAAATPPPSGANAPPPATPEAEGRQPLPAGVQPPPIR